VKSRTVAIALAFLIPEVSQGAEVQFEGYYRARGRAFDTLSLNRELSDSEGLSALIEHRLWLKPKFLINENVSLMTEFRGLDNVAWGETVYPAYDFVNQQDTVASLNDSLSAPTSLTDPSTGLTDFTLWRAWGEIYSPVGRFSFGRMPLHWGAGIWQNNGLGTFGEFGDSADRVQWQYLIQDQVFIQAAVDVNAEGFVNQSDDTTSYNFAVGLQRERVFTGINTQLRSTPSLDFSLFTADMAFSAEMGPLTVASEIVGQFGGGDLDTGVNEVRIGALGGVLGLGIDAKPWSISLDGGFATGDGDPTDEKIKTFSFDRDYNLGLLLFSLPVPVLAAASPNELNAGRNYDLAQSGDSISNAVFVNAQLGRELIENLEANLHFIGARTAKLPESEQVRRGYGAEFNLGLSYTPYDRAELIATGALFLPGSRFSDFEHEEYDGFEAPVFGMQLAGKISF
jgi:hypothetical protein